MSERIGESEQEKLARINRERIARDLAPHVPPEHIVSGECTFEALNRYLALHPIETIRAIEATRMAAWMYPLLKMQMAERPDWGLRDIIGDNPGNEPEE
jgi:hypothetical protein